jgi:hypothetical protein
MPTEPRKPKKHEARDEFPERVKFNRIALEATVVSEPDHQATVIRGKVRPEVTVRANLYNGNSSDTYTLRFIDERFLPLAARLQPGCRIHIENGKFRKRHGRNPLESEFEVKRFTVIRGELKPEIPPRRMNSRRRKYHRALVVPGWLMGFEEPPFSMNNLPKRKIITSTKFNAKLHRYNKQLNEILVKRTAFGRLFQGLLAQSPARTEWWKLEKIAKNETSPDDITQT